MTLAPLRLAATMVYAVPGVRLRVRHGDDDVEIARGRVGRDVVPACVFRDAVVRAHRGGAVLAPGSPAIDVGVPTGGFVHASGIVRVTLDTVELHAFATTLPAATCCVLFEDREHGDWVVRLHHDDGTDVTLVFMEASPFAREVVLDVMTDLLAACVAEELVTA